MEKSDKYYTLMESPNYKYPYGTCIADGYDREQVIRQAENYYSELAVENGEYGQGEKELKMVIQYESLGCIEVEQDVTISWYVERDTYDQEVRSYYYATRL